MVKKDPFSKRRKGLLIYCTKIDLLLPYLFVIKITENSIIKLDKMEYTFYNKEKRMECSSWSV